MVEVFFPLGFQSLGIMVEWKVSIKIISFYSDIPAEIILLFLQALFPGVLYII